MNCGDKESLQLSCRLAVLPCIQVLRPTEVPFVALIYFSQACFYSGFCLLISLGFLLLLYQNLFDF